MDYTQQLREDQWERIKDSLPGKAGDVTFPRFHRHLPKWENAEIGGQHEHEDPTIVSGDL